MFCGTLEPEESLLVVLGDPFAALVQNPKIELGTGDALLGGAPEPFATDYPKYQMFSTV